MSPRIEPRDELPVAEICPECGEILELHFEELYGAPVWTCPNECHDRGVWW